MAFKEFMRLIESNEIAIKPTGLFAKGAAALLIAIGFVLLPLLYGR